MAYVSVDIDEDGHEYIHNGAIRRDEKQAKSRYIDRSPVNCDRQETGAAECPNCDTVIGQWRQHWTAWWRLFPKVLVCRECGLKLSVGWSRSRILGFDRRIARRAQRRKEQQNETGG